MVEIQEPTDLAVRLEFERSGYVLPEAARFLGRDVDFGLSMIDFTPKAPAQIERDHRCNPRPKTELAPGLWEEELIGPDRTPCFRVSRLRLSQPVLRPGGEFGVCIVTQGSLTVEGGGAAHPLRPFDRFCLPAQLGPVRLIPQPTAEILLCFPPMPPSEPTRLAAASAG